MGIHSLLDRPKRTRAADQQTTLTPTVHSLCEHRQRAIDAVLERVELEAIAARVDILTWAWGRLEKLNPDGVDMDMIARLDAILAHVARPTPARWGEARSGEDQPGVSR